MPTTRLRPNYNLPEHRTGDTFRALDCVLKINGQPVDLTGATILCQVRSSPEGAVAMTLATSLPDPVNGVFRINEQAVNILPARYYYDVQITRANGFRETYLTGLWEILQDVSRA